MLPAERKESAQPYGMCNGPVPRTKWEGLKTEENHKIALKHYGVVPWDILSGMM